MSRHPLAGSLIRAAVGLRGMTVGNEELTVDMKAIVYSASGDSSVLSLVEREVPAPGRGEVRVRVAVSGVNPTDWKARASGTGLTESGVIVPDQDGAGVVDAIGENVGDLAVGDRVWVFYAQTGGPTGTAQDYTVLPASRVVRLPDGVGFDVAASLGVPAITAHRALTTHEFGPRELAAGSLDGRVVLVQGGAGAVGHAAIQLARWAGATVIATVSSDEKAQLARAGGAQHVLDYTTDDVVARVAGIAPDGVDHIVEVSIAENVRDDTAMAANHGVIAYYADNGGDTFTSPVRAAFAKNLRLQGVLLYTVGEEAFATAVADITAALADGALPVGADAGLPLTWFDLPQTADAHDAVEQGTVGKVLIRVADL